MTCDTARRTIIEGGSPAFLSRELREAQRHLQDCATCQEWREDEHAWRAALREKLPTDETPYRVKERLFAALAEARVGSVGKSRSRRSVLAVLVASCLVIALGGFVVWRQASHDGLIVATLSEDHLLYSSDSDPAEFSSPEPKMVAEWLSDRVEFAITVPQLPGARLLGGRLSTLADRRMAVTFYEIAGRRLSFFQMPAQGLATRSLRRMNLNGREFRCGHRKGVEVMTWTNRDVLFALVADLPEEDLLRLAGSTSS